MAYTIVGLGNPGDEYVHTRHNTGRMMVEAFADKEGVSKWHTDKKRKATFSSVAIGKEKAALVLPDSFMNNSGMVVCGFVKNAKQAIRTIVVYDDLDLPFGTFKISFNRGSGGHKGVESIMKKLKTREFVRVRVGISPTTAAGKLRKPKGDERVLAFIMKKFSRQEDIQLKKISKKVSEALRTIVAEGHETAMEKFN